MMIQVSGVTMTWWTDYVTTLMLHLHDQLHKHVGNRKIYMDSALKQTKPSKELRCTLLNQAEENRRFKPHPGSNRDLI